MDANGGKSLSPWKVPSRISLKRIRHKINSDLTLQSPTLSTTDKTSQKNIHAGGKRTRLMINKFALARSVSTPTSDENVTPTTPPVTENNNDQHLLARLHQIMPASTYNQSPTILNYSFDNSTNSPTSNPQLGELVTEFPVDWSLKSSCRFYSSASSSFLTTFTKLRSGDESLALDYISSPSPSTLLTDNDKAQFRALTSYWTHPHIAWLRLFPRTTQQAQTNVHYSSLDEHAQTTLQDEWKSAFQSLFQAFRTRHCSFFYMCTHTFNILFLDDISSQLIAIISPTTSGFRATLEREGIEFSMADGNPLNRSANKSVDGEENEDEDEADENDANCAQWLQDMGLSASSSAHSPTTGTERRSKKKSLKENPSSTTIVIRDPSSVNTLFNFLLNKSQRTCMSLTGPLAGIPPSLIAPRPFLHATLCYLNIHLQSNSMLTIDGGPLLPDRLKGLWNLIAPKSEQQLQMACTNVERTSALNFENEQNRTIKQVQITDNGDLRVQFATV